MLQDIETQEFHCYLVVFCWLSLRHILQPIACMLSYFVIAFNSVANPSFKTIRQVIVMLVLFRKNMYAHVGWIFHVSISSDKMGTIDICPVNH